MLGQEVTSGHQLLHNHLLNGWLNKKNKNDTRKKWRGGAPSATHSPDSPASHVSEMSPVLSLLEKHFKSKEREELGQMHSHLPFAPVFPVPATRAWQGLPLFFGSYFFSFQP